MRRSLVAFALTASFFTSFPNSPSLFDPLWAWLSSFWGHSAEAKEGFGLDPNGVNKAGIGLDPNGANSPTPPSPVEIGCGLDPNGVNTCEPPKN